MDAAPSDASANRRGLIGGAPSRPAGADFADIADIAAAPSPAAMLNGATAHALALAMYNAVAAQQQSAMIRQAAVATACAGMMELAFESGGVPAPLPTAGKGPGSGDGDAASAPAPAAGQPDPSASSPAADDAQHGPPRAEGEAFQLVAVSVALTVQDQADALAAATTLSTIAQAIALTRYAITGDESHARALEAAEQMPQVASDLFEEVCSRAVAILDQFRL